MSKPKNWDEFSEVEREAWQEKERGHVRKYHEANREKELLRKRKYHEANREKELLRKRKYYEANREKETERLRKYHEAKREKVIERLRKYRAKFSQQNAADEFFAMGAAIKQFSELIQTELNPKNEHTDTAKRKN